MQAVAAVAPVVSIDNGILSVLSTNVADVFGKVHRDVIRAIETIVSRSPKERAQNFRQVIVRRPSNLGTGVVESKAYRLTRAGFVFLAMGFTGEKADQFKWAYIDEFDRMEAELHKCPVAAQLPAERLSETQAYTIQSEVGKRARGIGANYQTIYRALKARFKVTKYTHILARDFDDAVHFIRTCDLKLPDRHESAKAEPPKANQKMYQVSEQFVENQRTFVYCWRYLFRDDLERFYRLLYDMNSPYAPKFWEAIHNLNLATLENSLDRLGFPVKDLDCYKHWASKQIA